MHVKKINKKILSNNIHLLQMLKSCIEENKEQHWKSSLLLPSPVSGMCTTALSGWWLETRIIPVFLLVCVSTRTRRLQDRPG